jgi:hypothetical protein
MVVHADQSRQHGVTPKIDDLRVSWNLDRGRRTYRGDRAVVDDEGPVVCRRAAGAVDDLDVRECHAMRPDANDVGVRLRQRDT